METRRVGPFQNTDHLDRRPWGFDMSWCSDADYLRRRIRGGPQVRNVEMLEARVLLADGISPLGGSPISAQVGVPIINASFARYTVSYPSGEPGDQWRANINFGDGQVDGPVIPIQ